MELEDRVEAWIRSHQDWTDKQLMEEMDHETFPLDPYEAWGLIQKVRSEGETS